MSSTVHLIPPRESSLRRPTLLLLALLPLLFGALTLYLGQDVNWDFRNYHWYNAYALIMGRHDLDILPSQTPWFYNPAIDIPFYLLATHVKAPLAGFILGAVEGLNVVLLFMLAYASLVVPNPRHKIIVCTLVASLGMLGGGGIALLGTTFYDNVTSLGFFLSSLLIIKNYHALLTAKLPLAVVWAMLIGLPAGMMMGLKLPAVIFCVGFCFAILAMPGPFKRLFMVSFSFGLGILVGTLVTLGPWAWFLSVHYGNPLFPYFNEIFKSPLAPLTSARDIQFIPSSLHDIIFFPYIFAVHPLRVGEIPWRDWRIPTLYSLLPIAIIVRLLFGRTKEDAQRLAEHHAVRYLLWASSIIYILWLFIFSIYRYLVPLEMLTPLLLIFVVGFFPLSNRTRALLVSSVFLVLAATIQPGNWSRRDHWNDQYVAATIPSLPDVAHTMILMASFEPYAHILSTFPPAIPFVRIQSNFVSPGEAKGFNALIEARVRQHQGPLYLLIPPWQHQLASDALKHYKLTFQPKACQTVVDRLYDDGNLDLCKIEPLAVSP